MNAPPVAPKSVKSSASVQGSVGSPPAFPLAPQSAPPSAPKPVPPPGAKGSVQAAKSGSGSGSHLPELPLIGWEENRKGGVEAWHVPPGATKRKEKTYLGYAGKRLLAEWEKLNPDARRLTVERWIRDKRAEKGINL